MDSPSVQQIKSVFKAKSKSSRPEEKDMMASSSASSVFSSVELESVGDQSVVGSDQMSNEHSIVPAINEQKICPHCGKEVSEPETKLIPSQSAWLCFAFMFFCLMWWISWIPFLIDKCGFKKPVQMCPHCYRRLYRPPV